MWKANAYRRAALQEIETARDPSAIAEILRRTALAVSSRQDIATLAGTSWTDWLASRISTAMPDPVREILSSGIYQKHSPDSLAPLRDYARAWIANHKSPARLP